MAVKLSVVIPCFNEEKRFKKSLESYLDFLNKQKYQWEVILVNDGSRDKTLEFMQQTTKINNKISIVSYKKNHGKGYAIKCGVEKAKGEIILFSDLDEAVSIETINVFFDFFKKGYQIVIGSRRVKGAKIVRHQHPVRELLGQCFTLLVRILIDWQIRDATCGFKAIKNDTAKKLFSKIKIYDWAFDAELLYLCKNYNFKLAQAPVAWTDVKGSKVSVAKDVLSSLAGLIKIRINEITGKYK